MLQSRGQCDPGVGLRRGGLCPGSRGGKIRFSKHVNAEGWARFLESRPRVDFRVSLTLHTSCPRQLAHCSTAPLVPATGACYVRSSVCGSTGRECCEDRARMQGIAAVVFTSGMLHAFVASAAPLGMDILLQHMTMSPARKNRSKWRMLSHL